MSKNKNGNTAWHEGAGRGQVAILQKLWNWAKEMQLKPEEIRNDLLLPRTFMETQPGTRQQREAKLEC